MKISIASDHEGFRYKTLIAELLRTAGHEVHDFGTDSEQPVGDPLFLVPAAQAVVRGECERGIVVGGSGSGEAITANKVDGIRCAVCWSIETAEHTHRQPDINMIALGQRVISAEVALNIVRTWIATGFAEPATPDPGSSPKFDVHEKTLLIRPEFLNHHGGLFGGYMMEWADDMAFNAASLSFPGAAFVTRRFDAFDFISSVRSGDIIKIYARVAGVGTSSCQVSVWCLNARTAAQVFRTVAIMVNIDATGKKAPIPFTDGLR